MLIFSVHPLEYLEYLEILRVHPSYLEYIPPLCEILYKPDDKNNVNVEETFLQASFLSKSKANASELPNLGKIIDDES